MFPLEVIDIHNCHKIDIMDIWKISLTVTLKSFKIILFVVKWYRLWLNWFDLDRAIIEHANGFTMVNTKSPKPRTLEPYFLPNQREHVFYWEFLGIMGWSFVIRHDPRGRVVKYNLNEY